MSTLTISLDKSPIPGLAGKLRTFIIDNFMFGENAASLANNDSFLDKGIIDSTGVLELVSFIQDEYKIVIEDEELIPDNLDSIDKLVHFIEGKLANR